jgi:Domain of unknown function (DUF4389)
MPRYPIRVEAEVEGTPSRWLWLVKWVLLLPHFVVLFFLWVAFTVLTIVAGVSILITGRYPRAIFEFNVGVLRWSWRVAFYGIGAFGTDRYPPFSLDPDPTYPATLEVEYPERLSRGLVLVKWWLLAIPQYVVVGIFSGGWGFGLGGWRGAGGGGGLIAVLAVVSAVILAVTRRYPTQLFDLLMGLNRWCFRVVAYAALMRDEYPPFRLDTGGAEPEGPPPEHPVLGAAPGATTPAVH